MARFTVNTLILNVILLLNICQYSEMSIYAGLRRRPTALHDALQQKIEQQLEMPTDYLAQLMEENARRRLQQQFEQQLALINRQMLRQREQQRQRERYRQLQAMNERQNEEDEDVQEDYESSNINNDDNNNNVQYNDQYDDSNAEFSYKYPPNELNGSEDKERIPFAVGPSDPRFYEEESRDEADPNLNSQVLDEYEEYKPAESKPSSYRVPTQANAITSDRNIVEPTRAAVLAPAPVETSKLVDNSAPATFHRIKPHMAAAVTVAAGVGDGDGADDRVAPMKPVHNDVDAVTKLIEKLQKQGKTEAILNTHHAAAIGHNANTVVRQHLGIEGEMGVYVVALIAGVSAAITVGLIALGVAWYTLRNKTKAAADVEYPAYGVTGPNKDISPSGDRKLAQSAQMYHYQHQKQQIIAMENRQAVEGNCGLSDVESDDDNEEGDYTVYECPGLAPTCEMEVKNPLFLDETPVTPGAGAGAGAVPKTSTAAATNNNMSQAAASQSATRKSSGKASTSMATSSEEKTKKNKK